ncbi:MAG TPA: hypothetical protein VGD27_15395, partial [Longimicrobiales bacterium]
NVRKGKRWPVLRTPPPLRNEVGWFCNHAYYVRAWRAPHVQWDEGRIIGINGSDSGVGGGAYRAR